MDEPGERLGIFMRNPIGLGCWALGGKQWGGQSERQSFAAMEESLEQGIRHFDTAKGYGVSEKLVGQFLKDKREEVFLASKVFPGRGPGVIREHLSQSLDNLQTGYLDLYYLHYPVCRDCIEEQMEVLQQAREDGLVRYTGVSNYSLEDLKRVPGVDFLQIGYHALWRKPEKDILPYCQANGIRVVAYSPLGQGILTGKFDRNPVFAKGDNRPRTVLFRSDIWPKVYQAIEAMKPVARAANISLAQLAIQWSVSRKGITGVVAGARNRQQARENAGALGQPVDPSVLEAVTRIGDRFLPGLPDVENIFAVSFT